MSHTTGSFKGYLRVPLRAPLRDTKGSFKGSAILSGLRLSGFRVFKDLKS